MLRTSLWSAAVLGIVGWMVAAQVTQAVADPSSGSAKSAHSKRHTARTGTKMPVHSAIKEIPPLPERKPASGQQAAEPDVWTPAEIAAAQTHCAAVLKPLDAVTLPQDPIKEGKCGAPAPIRLVSLGKEHRVKFEPPAVMNCDLAVAVSRWLEKDVQPMALKHLGVRIARLEIMSDYSCRASSGRVHNRLSEHAFADAIDIGTFITEDGKSVAVLGTWGETQRDMIAKAEAAKAAAEKAASERAKADKPPAKDAGQANATQTADAKADTREAPPLPVRRKTARGTINLAAARLGGPHLEPNREKAGALPAAPAPATPQSRFLHEVHAAACRLFGTTLGPEANEDHRNHFHVDMAERKYKKICD